MSTDLPIPSPTPRPPVPPDGETDLPARNTTELGDDEDLPTEPGTEPADNPQDDESPPWPSSVPTGDVPMSFRDEDGHVHLTADMLPSDQRRAGGGFDLAASPAPALLRS